MFETYGKRYFWTFYLVGSLAVAFLTGMLVSQVARWVAGFHLVSTVSCPGPAQIETPPASPPLTAFLKRNLFHAATGAPDSGPTSPLEPVVVLDPDECWPTTTDRKLLATMVAEIPEDSLAIFSTARGPAYVYSIGDQIDGGARIRAIDLETVILWRNDRCERLTFSAPPRAASKVKRRVKFRPKTKSFIERIHQNGPNQWIIERSAVEDAMADLRHVSTGGRIIPHFHRGRADGFELWKMAPDSVWSKLGLKAGDVLKRINGHDISDPRAALEVYGKLKHATDITLDLVRKTGEKKTLRYAIRSPTLF